MSDFFMSNNSTDEFKKRLSEYTQNVADERLQNRQRYGVELSDKEYAQINNLIADSENQDEEAHKIGSAILFSKKLGIPVDEAYTNLDSYTEALWGTEKSTSYRSAFTAISDMFVIGNNGLKLGNLGNKLKEAEIAGDQEMVDQLYKEIELIEQDNAYRQDNAPRSWVTEALKSGAQTLPFSGEAAALGLFGNFIAPGVGTVLAFGSSSSMASGQEYIDMRREGVTADTARKVAGISGGIQGLIEVALGTTTDYLAAGAGKKMAETAAGQVAKKASEAFAKRFHYGAGKKVAVELVTAWTADKLGEGTEEALQEITSIISNDVARSMDGLGLSDETIADKTKQIVEAFKGGVVGAIVLGLPLDVINTNVSIKDYKKLKEAASTISSKEMFEKVAENNPVLNELKDEKKKEVINEIWNNVQNEMEAAELHEARGVAEVNTADESFENIETDEETGETNAAPVARDELTGGLITQSDITEEDGNIKKESYRAGDNTKENKNVYGYINATIDEDNKTVTIDKFSMNSQREGLRQELYDNFARDHAGYKIEWNPQLKIAKDVKERLVAANPSGKNNGLNYYSSQDEIANIKTRKEVANQIREAYKKVGKKLTNEQVAADVSILESLYNRLGRDLKDRGVNNFTDYVSYTFGNKLFGDQKEAFEAAARQGEQGKVQGASVTRNLKEFDRGMKALIYVTQNGDFSTFSHEVAHIVRKQLTGSLLDEATKAFGVQQDENGQYNWTQAQEEAFAYGFEQFLRTGQAKNEGLRTLFQKLAQFLNDCMTALKSQINITPEIEKVYNELLAGDKSVLAAAKRAAEQSDMEYRQQQEEEAVQAKEAEYKQQQEERAANMETTDYEETVEKPGIEINEKDTATPNKRMSIDRLLHMPDSYEKYAALQYKARQPGGNWSAVLSELERMGPKYYAEYSNKLLGALGPQQQINDAVDNTGLSSNDREIAKEILNDPEETIGAKEEVIQDVAGEAFNEEIPDALFQIIGELGATNLDRVEEVTIRMDNKKVAEEMEKAGKDAKAIRLATGWERGKDKKWKYETKDDYHLKNNIKTNNKLKRYEEELKKAEDELAIYTKATEEEAAKIRRKIEGIVKHGAMPEGTTFETMQQEAQNKVDMYKNLIEFDGDLDVEKSLKNFIEDGINDPNDIWEIGNGYYLKDIIDNKELFNAYPQLENYIIQFTKKQGGTFGSLSDNIITIYPRAAASYSEFKSTLAHEIQHAIQNIEGFAVGGSTDTATQEAQKIKDAFDIVYFYNEIKEKVKEDPEKYNYNQLAALNDIKKDYIEADCEDWLPSEDVMTKAFNLWVRGYGIEEQQKIVKDNDLDKYVPHVDKDGFRNYKRLAGEVESRNVQTRINMSDIERLNTLLEDTEDVYRRDQLVMFEAARMASADLNALSKVNEKDFMAVSGGNNEYMQLSHDPLNAALFLIKHKQGMVRNVFDSKDNIAGKIGLSYGHEKEGLFHLLQDHINSMDFPSLEEALKAIEDVLSNGTYKEVNGKYNIDKDGYRVVITKDKKNNFVITAFNSTTARSKKEKLRGNTTLLRQSASYSQNGTPVSGSLNNSNNNTNNNNVNNDNMSFQTEEAVGKALYTINKEAKKYRDLKRDLYDTYKGGNFTEELINEIKENIPGISYDNDEFGVYSNYDDWLTEDNIEDKLREARHELDIAEESEDEDEQDFQKEVIKDYEKAEDILNKLNKYMSTLKDKQNELYKLKEKVIAKLNLPVSEYHSFDGDIRPLYKYGDYSFHGDIINEVPAGYEVKELQEISSENKLENPITIDEAVDTLKKYLNDNPSILFQTAYHGSAADFDKFDTEHYGLSGEGSMSFGYGTYVAGNEEIARDYAIRQYNSKFETEVKESRLANLNERIADDERKLKTLESPEAYFAERDREIESLTKEIEADEAAGDPKEWKKNLLKGISKQYTEENRVSYLKAIKASVESDKKEIAEIEKALEYINANKDNASRKLYTVDIPDKGFIKWDKTVPKATRARIVDNLYRKLIKEDYAGAERELRYELSPLVETALTGQDIYQDVWTYLGSDKEASKFLYDMGFSGIDYPAGTNYGTEIENARNYVIFNDDDAKIIDKLSFQTQQELYNDARSFESWTDFMDAYQTDFDPAAFEDPMYHSQVPSGASAQWYQTTWELANGIQPEESMNEQEVQDKYAKEGTEPRALDSIFAAELTSNPNMFDDFMHMVAYYDNLDLDKEYGQVADEEEARERDHVDQIKTLIDRTFNTEGTTRALNRIAAGGELTPDFRKRLITEIGNAAREYRALYAEIMQDPTYRVNEEDTVENMNKQKVESLNKRYNLQLPEVDQSRMTPRQRIEYGNNLENEEIAQQLKDGTLKMDDQVDKYINSLKAQIAEQKKMYKELQSKILEETARIADEEQQDLLKLNEKLNALKLAVDKRDNEMMKKLSQGLKISAKYQKESQNLKHDYNEIMRKYKDALATTKITGEVQRALDMQEKLSGALSQINKLEDERITMGDVQKLRKNLVKRTMRRVKFDTVDYDNARQIIAIQRIFEPNLLGGVNKWIGQRDPYLRGVISAVITDKDYRNDLTNHIRERATSSNAYSEFYATWQDLITTNNVDEAMKKFNSWDDKTRKRAIMYLPKEDWIKELQLKELEKEREESIDLDIGIKERRVPMRDEKGELIYKPQYDENGKPIKNPEKQEYYMKTMYEFDASEEIKTMIRDAVGEDIFNNLLYRPFSEWTVEEMEKLAKRVDDLYTEGRDILAAKKQLQLEKAAAIRQQIEKAVKDTGIVINDDDTPEEKAKKQAKIDKILGLSDELKGTNASKDTGFKSRINRLLHGYVDANVLRVARILDGNTEGVNVNELYRKEDECYNAKTRSINNRVAKINQVMTENNITLDELASTVKVGNATFSIDEMLFIAAANEDYVEDPAKLAKGETGIAANDDWAATSRNAVMFGNLFSDTASTEFKEECVAMDEEMQRRIDADELTAVERNAQILGELVNKPGTARYISQCHAVMEQILTEVNNLDDKYKALLKVIADDYAEQYDRMNEISIREFNTPVHRVKCYVPLVRLESNGDTNVNQVKEDLLAALGQGAGKQWVNKGMTQRRTSMNPLHQKPVQMGLYKTWADSNERTEHFIAYSGYVRELNRVYKSRDAQYTRQFIENRYGKGMLSYLDDYINEVANPNANKIREKGAELLHTLRGKTAPAYLAWKASAIIKQGLTSPWPYMQFINPAEYAAASWKCITSKGAMYDAIRQKSVFMNNRVMDPMNDLIDEMAEKANQNKFDKALNKFNKKGMAGLEWIDWVCVAPGWYACYEKKYNELVGKNQEVYEATKERLKEENYYAEVGTPAWKTSEQIEKLAQKAMDEDVEKRAVQYADDCTRACQPSNRSADISPLFKNSSEAMKAYLQFQTSLNVIWQNIRYDIPYAIKKNEFNRVAMTIVGYALAGIFMNSVMDGLGGDDDDDGSKIDDRIKKQIFYATTQFTDAVPMVGSELTNTMDQLITGKRQFMNSGTDMTPTLTKMLSILTNAKKGNWEKAAEMTAEGFAMYLGLPVSGGKEIKKLAGVGDGDGKAGLNLGNVYGILDTEDYK